jgi:hypothetical protein
MSESGIKCDRRQVELEGDFVVAETVYYVEDIDKCGWDWVAARVRERLEPAEVHRGKLNDWYGFESVTVIHFDRINI